MRMRSRRMCSAVLAVVMILCLFSIPVVSGEEAVQVSEETMRRAELLQGLGIVEYEMTQEVVAQPLSRQMAYGAALGLLGDLTDGLSYTSYVFADIADLPEANAIQFAYDQGCVDAGWKFDPQGTATVGEILRLIVSEMGYGEIAKTLGDGVTGYMTMANRLGLTNGLKVSAGDTLTWETLIDILYQSLDAEILHLLGYNSDGSTLGKVTGVTMLNVYFDIYKISGVVNANESTALSGYTEAGEGYAVIGDQQLKVGTTRISDMLGYYVDCYAKESNSTYTAVYASIHNQNSVWEVHAADLLPENTAFTAFRIVYQNEKGTVKSISLPSDVNVIYNGKALFDYTADDLKIKLGTLVAIDPTGGARPQTVLVNEYKNYIVDSYSEAQQMLYSKNEEPLPMDPTADIVIRSIGGEEYLLTDLTEHAILSLYVSRDREYIHGTVVKNKISGQITQLKTVGGETYLTMDSGTYKVSRGWNHKDTNGQNMELKVGKRYLMYLDIMGEVASFIERNSGLQYGFLYEASVEQLLGTEIRFRIFTDSSAWEELDLAKKVTVDGTTYKETEIPTLTALFSDQKIKPQMVKVMVNNDAEITKIYTANGLDRGLDADALTAKLNVNVTTQFKSLGSIFSDYSYSLSGAKIFMLPKKDGVYDDEAFEVVGTSSLKNDRSYNFKDFYDVTDTMQVKVALMEAKVSEYDYWNGYAVFVKDVVEYYEDGEIKTALEAMNKGKNVTYYTMEEEYFDDVHQGDILVLHTNPEGKVDANAKKIYDAESKTVTSSVAVNNKEIHYVWNGTVKAKDATNVLIETDSGNKCVPWTLINYLTFYDTDAGTAERLFRIGESKEVTQNAKALIYSRSGGIMDIIVFE